MNSITVSKADLLGKLHQNRDAHRALFDAAQIGFRERVIEELDKRLELTRRGKRVDLTIRLAEPIDQTADYERVIAMLKMDKGDEVELSEHDFGCYVMDDWSWKENVTVTNSRYIQ